MRALVYRYNSICEPDILAVLKECGFEIDEITAAMYNKDMPAFETLQLVSETLKKNPYDMVFTINFSRLFLKCVISLKFLIFPGL